MGKKLLTMALALMLALAMVSSALADDVLVIKGMTPVGSGYLRVVIGTNHTDDADLNFTASTENGDLSIVDVKALRRSGTSWFVIMDYGNYNDKEAYRKVEDRILEKMADLVEDQDNGALVRCDADHTIVFPRAASELRQDLRAAHEKTDSQELAHTFRSVVDYIRQSPDQLKDNVVIMLMTPCPASKVTETMVNDIGEAINSNSAITTHVIMVGGKKWHSADRVLGERLCLLAGQSIGGFGYFMQSLVEASADDAVLNIGKAERDKVLLLLDARIASLVGQKITIVQKLADGREISTSHDLSDQDYQNWQEEANSRQIDQPTPPPQSLYHPTGAGGTVIAINTPVPVAEEGLSTELLIGIIIGAIVLVLLLILLLLRTKKKGGKTAATTAATYATAAQAQPAASGGTSVTLTGQNGTVLKGQLKNGRLTVGRNGSQATLSVPNDGKLSGLHATFTKQGNTLMITDNGSTNGTKVNGTKINPGTPVSLRPGDSIAMGSTVYTVSWKG